MREEYTTMAEGKQRKHGQPEGAAYREPAAASRTQTLDVGLEAMTRREEYILNSGDTI